MNEPDHDTAGLTRRGLIVGAVAAALVAPGGVATANPGRPGGSAPAGSVGGSGGGRLGFSVPRYRTAVDGESVEVDRVDRPVAPGIVLTTFSTFGRGGWTRVHVPNADLDERSVGVDLVAGKVSETRTVSAAADAQHAVAAVNGDFFRWAGRATASSARASRARASCVPAPAAPGARATCASSAHCTGWPSRSARSRSNPAPRRPSASSATTPTGSTPRCRPRM